MTETINGLMAQALEAQVDYASFDQAAVDNIVKEVASRLKDASVDLAKVAQSDTGFGNVMDKTTKNLFASEVLYESIKDIKTVGIVEELTEKKMLKVAVPMGVVAALIPSTNPTSTTIYKSLLALKTRNAIILSPHPKALNAISQTVDIIREVLVALDAPKDLVQVISEPSLEGTQALMAHPSTALILATGGEAMVRAAYSSGNPAIGVGPGNTPVLIEKSANIKQAIQDVVSSKTFDNGTICASEQSLVVEESIKEEVLKELETQHVYMMTEEESAKVGAFIMRDNGAMNPEIVGKTALAIAELSGITVPEDTKILISEQSEISKKNPYSREKLSPILALFTVKDTEDGISVCDALLRNEGAGHTAMVHTQSDEVVRAFGTRIPASRILVNTLASLGAIGGTTNLNPSLTLGCGSVGGSSLSENVHVAQLLNTNYVAYGVDK